MPQRQVIIVNKRGLHARAANRVVSVAQSFACSIQLRTTEKQADGKSIMAVMLLAAAKGHELTLYAEGEDSEAALDALEELIADRFGEED